MEVLRRGKPLPSTVHASFLTPACHVIFAFLLQAERARARVMQMQRNTAQLLIAATALNIGTVLAVSAMQRAATATFVASGMFVLLCAGGFIKLLLMERRERQLTGAS